MAEDSVRGLKAYFQMSNYAIIYTEGIFDDLYLLTEYDGETDIDVYTSELMLIYTGDSVVHRYYSQTTGQTIPGKPRFIHGRARSVTSTAARQLRSIIRPASSREISEYFPIFPKPAAQISICISGFSLSRRLLSARMLPSSVRSRGSARTGTEQLLRSSRSLSCLRATAQISSGLSFVLQI